MVLVVDMGDMVPCTAASDLTCPEGTPITNTTVCHSPLSTKKH
jgi:hypothetical protein